MNSTWIKSHLNYANVVASIALFVVLGGGAYATIDRKITTKDLKKAAVTAPKIKGQAVKTTKLADGAVTQTKLSDGVVATPQIADGAVNAPKILDGAVNAAKIAATAVNQAKIADGAVSHAKLSSDASPRWAVVNGSTGNSTRSRGVAGSERLSTGAYRVHFAWDVTGCSYVAQTGGTSDQFPVGTASAARVSGDSNAVYVATRDLSGDQTDLSFHLQVLC